MQLHDIKKFAFKHFCESLYICNKNSCLNSFTKRFLVVIGFDRSQLFPYVASSIVKYLRTHCAVYCVFFFIYNNEVKDSSSSDQVV